MVVILSSILVFLIFVVGFYLAKTLLKLSVVFDNIVKNSRFSEHYREIELIFYIFAFITLLQLVH